MIKNDYNGWTNKATWNINLTYDGIFQDLCTNSVPFDDIDHLADAFESVVRDCEESLLVDISPASLVVQCFEDYMAQVNWTEIAEHYAQDFPECIEQEEVEA